MCRNWGSSDSIATGYRLDVWGSIPGGNKGFFSSTKHPDRLRGPPSLISNGYQGCFPLGVKWMGREADRSPPASAKVKNSGSVPSLPHPSSWHGA
jgi:hypothetical protein